MTFLLCDPAGASTSLTSRIHGMTTHTHTNILGDELVESNYYSAIQACTEHNPITPLFRANFQITSNPYSTKTM